MSQNHIQQTWREYLVKALKNRYQLAEQEAEAKIEGWLQSLDALSGRQTRSLSKTAPARMAIRKL